MSFNLDVTDDGLSVILKPSDTKMLTWSVADYEVKVNVHGVIKVIFEGRLKLAADLGV